MEHYNNLKIIWVSHSWLEEWKKNAFYDIKDLVWEKLQTWKEKTISQGGKEVFLKAMALAIPSFVMSYFKLSDNFCSKLESIMGRFCWGQRGNEQKIHWISWDRLCESKFFGGLGFQNLKDFNLALLAKQDWWLVQNEDSLVHKIYKVCYVP